MAFYCHLVLLCLCCTWHLKLLIDLLHLPPLQYSLSCGGSLNNKWKRKKKSFYCKELYGGSRVASIVKARALIWLPGLHAAAVERDQRESDALGHKYAHAHLTHRWDAAAQLVSLRKHMRSHLDETSFDSNDSAKKPDVFSLKCLCHWVCDCQNKYLCPVTQSLMMVFM